MFNFALATIVCALAAISDASPALVPSGSAPVPSGLASRQAAPAPVRIHPVLNTAKCLDVKADALANGTAVQLFECNGTPAQNWLIQPGQTKVQLNGTDFCLDAGSAPANGVGMKIWKCFDNLPAQEWFLTGDNRIALLNQGFCLDVTNGNTADGTQMQTWHCTANDDNQAWVNF